MGRQGVGIRWQLGTVLIFLGLGLALMGLTPNWQGMIAGMALQQTGAGMAIPTLIAWAQGQLPPSHRGRGMGIWTSTFFFGQFTSPLLVSFIRTQAGSMQAAFLVAGVLSVIGAVIIVLAMSKQSQPAASLAKAG